MGTDRNLLNKWKQKKQNGVFLANYILKNLKFLLPTILNHYFRTVFYHSQNDFMCIISLDPTALWPIHHYPMMLLVVAIPKEATSNVLKYVLTAYTVYTNNLSLRSHLYIITWAKYGQHQKQEAGVLMKD